jgi:hypothetical protein
LKNINVKIFNKIKTICNQIIESSRNKYIFSLNSLNLIRLHPNYNIAKFKYFSSRTLLKRILSYFFFEKKKILKNTDTIIISNLVNKKKILINDLYFSEIIKKIDKNKLLLIYRNINRINLNIKNKNTIILNNSRNFFFEVYFFYKILIETIKLKITVQNKKNYYLIKNYFSLKNIYSSIFNLFEVKKIISIIRASKPKKVFFTLEGYAWEKLLINEIRSLEKIPTIYGYYFSIISKYQNYPLRNYYKNFVPDYILTSGNVAKKKFIKFGFDPNKIFNIGSNKNVCVNKRKINNNKGVLLLPEGFETEINTILDFSIECSKIKKIPFILRLHPSYKLTDDFQYRLSQIQSIYNIRVSSNDLNDDFKKSCIAIYRGSSAAVEATLNGLYPAYLAKKKEPSIDPLYEIESLKKKFYTSKEFVEFYASFKNNKVYNTSFIKINKYCSEYFTKPQNNLIMKLLK